LYIDGFEGVFELGQFRGSEKHTGYGPLAILRDARALRLGYPAHLIHQAKPFSLLARSPPQPELKLEGFLRVLTISNPTVCLKDDDHNLLGQKILRRLFPCKYFKVEGLRIGQDFLSALCINNCPCGDKPTRHPREQDKESTALLRGIPPRNIPKHTLHEASHRFVDPGTNPNRLTGELWRQRRQHTARSGIIQVLDAEVSFDHCMQLLPCRGAFRRGDHAIGHLFETSRNSFRVEVPFTLKMPVEPAVGQTQLLHESGYAVAFATAQPKRACRCGYDLLARLGFLFDWVPHAPKITTII